MPNAGDTQTATLTVAPFDGSTVAVLTVRSPAGTISTPTASSVDGGATWTADVPYPVAGVFTLTWNVTGTGAAVEQYRVPVAPLLPGAGRAYANSTNLADFLQAAPPLDSDKQLRDATLELDFALKGALYDVDDDGEPTDPMVIEAFRDACCAVVEWWEETGDPLGAAASYDSVSIGSAALSRKQAFGAPAAEVLGSRAIQILQGCPNLLLGAVTVL